MKMLVGIPVKYFSIRMYRFVKIKTSWRWIDFDNVPTEPRQESDGNQFSSSQFVHLPSQQPTAQTTWKSGIPEFTRSTTPHKMGCPKAEALFPLVKYLYFHFELE